MLVLAHLGNSSGISPFVFYLINSLLKQRNKVYTTTLAETVEKPKKPMFDIEKIFTNCNYIRRTEKLKISIEEIEQNVNFPLPQD